MANQSYCCPIDTQKRNISCYSIPQLNQTCTDYFVSEPSYQYLKYSTCIDQKNTCRGKSIYISLENALTGINQTIQTLPDQKLCFWNLTYSYTKNEKDLMAKMHRNSKLRISIKNIKGIRIDIFDHQEVLMEAIQQNITDNDQPYYETTFMEFKNGEQIFILVMKDTSLVNNTEFLIELNISVIPLKIFEWVPIEDEAYLAISCIMIVIMVVVSAVLYQRTLMYRLRIAQQKIQSRKVKTKKKRGQKQRRSNAFNPYQNFNPNNKQDPNNPGQIGGLLNGQIYKGDQSIRAKLSLMDQKIEDSFFSEESNSDSQNADENQSNIISNKKLIQGQEHFKNSHRQEENKQEQSQNKPVSINLGKLTSTKFAHIRRRNNFMDQTQADFEGVLNNDTHIQSNKEMNLTSQSQGSPPLKKVPLNEILDDTRLQPFGAKKQSEQVSYNKIWKEEKKSVQSARKIQNLSMSQKRGTSHSPKSTRSRKTTQKQNYIASSFQNNANQSQSFGQNNQNTPSKQSQKGKKIINKNLKNTVKTRPSPLKIQHNNKQFFDSASRLQIDRNNGNTDSKSKSSPQFETKSMKEKISDFSNRSISNGKSRSSSQSPSRSPSGSQSKSSHTNINNQQQQQQKNIVQSVDRRKRFQETDIRSKSEICVLPLGQEIQVAQGQSTSNEIEKKSQKSKVSDSTIFKKASFEDVSSAVVAATKMKSKIPLSLKRDVNSANDVTSTQQLSNKRRRGNKQ